MGGTSMAVKRWAREPQFYRDRVFVGSVLDVGAGHDPLIQYRASLPRLTSFTCLDQDAPTMPSEGAEWIRGDASQVPEDRLFDVVYSSHCLEHLVDPETVVEQWWSVLKPGGYLVLILPSWDTYEKRIWPPHLNTDHKTAWVLHQEYALLDHLNPDIQHIRGLVGIVWWGAGNLVRALTLDENYEGRGGDQTADGTCECGLEAIWRKA